MSSADRIKHFFKKAELGINSDTDEKVFQDILQAQQKTTKQTPAQPILWRIIMKSQLTKISIASIVVLAIAGAFYFGLTGNSVTAAEMLEKVIQTNANYKGWIHITHILTEKVLQGKYEAEGIAHMNTNDGTIIGEQFTNGERIIKYYCPPQKEYIEYNSLDGRINIYDLDSFPAEQLVAMYPLTIDSVLSTYRQATGKEPYNISVQRDGNLERFDIMLFENEEEAEHVPHAGIPVTTTIWVDKVSRLISKFQFGERTMLFKYGMPFIESIYDLGVPRDSLVIDNRKTIEIQTVLDRLNNRIQSFGDYCAVITETPINDDNTPDLDYCAISLIFQKGQAWFFKRYLVGSNKYQGQNPRKSVMETPLTWPILDFKSILEKLKYASPSEYFIYDGQNLYINSVNASRNLDIKGNADRIREDFDLPHIIWFGKNYGPGTKTELIKSNDETNHIELHVEFNSSVSPTEQERREAYYWFDPQRQDMPVKKLSRSYSSDQKITSEFNTIYLDYSQLPDGQWYPTCWQTYGVFEGTKQDIREFRLTLIPDYEIEEDWFKPPQE